MRRIRMYIHLMKRGYNHKIYNYKESFNSSKMMKNPRRENGA